jgi:glc operon protein GlcG
MSPTHTARTCVLKPMFAIALTLLSATAMAAEQHVLSSDQASQILTRAEAIATSSKTAVCIALVDTGGNLLTFKRMENAPLGCIEAAIAKARSSAFYRTATATVGERIAKGETTLMAMPNMLPLGGGLPLHEAGAMAGAIGISGGTSAGDAATAQAAAQGY